MKAQTEKVTRITVKQGLSAEERAQIQERRASERQHFSLDQEETAAALQGAVDRLQEFFTECAFHLSGSDGMSTNWLGKRPWLEDLVSKLDPYAPKLRDRILAALAETQNRDLQGNFDNVDDDVYQLADRIMRSSYAIGILAGAKLAGASGEELAKMTKRILV
jgi:hypothetical protein